MLLEENLYNDGYITYYEAISGQVGKNCLNLVSLNVDYRTLVVGKDYQIDNYNVDTSKYYLFHVERVLNMVIVMFDFANKVSIAANSQNTAGEREALPIGVNSSGTLGFWQLEKTIAAGTSIRGSLTYVMA